jgi:hypothetical protein
LALSISALIVAVAGVGQAVLPEPDVRFALIAGIPANVARALLLVGSAVYIRYTYRYEHRQETRQRSRQRRGTLTPQPLQRMGCSARRGAHHGGVLTTTPQPLQRMGCGLRARKECSPRRLARFPTGPRRREREQLLGAPSSSSGADGAAPRRELPDHLHASAHHGAALEPRRELPDHLDAALTTALTDAEARAIRQMATGTYLLLSKRGDDHLMVT